MSDVEGDRYWERMVMDTPWGESNFYTIEEALRFARRLGAGQPHSGYVLAEPTAASGPAVVSTSVMVCKTKR